MLPVLLLVRGLHLSEQGDGWRKHARRLDTGTAWVE